MYCVVASFAPGAAGSLPGGRCRAMPGRCSMLFMCFLIYYYIIMACIRFCVFLMLCIMHNVYIYIYIYVYLERERCFNDLFIIRFSDRQGDALRVRGV